MIKIITPFFLIFLAFIVAKQFKPEPKNAPVIKQLVTVTPENSINQMPREAVEYGRNQIIKPKRVTVSNKPHSAKTKRSILSAKKIPIDTLNLNDGHPKNYIFGSSDF